MEINLKLQALTRLSKSSSAEAILALETEVDESIRSLETNTQYDKLEESIQILEVIGHRFSKKAVDGLKTFLDRTESIQLTYSNELEMFANSIADYQNSDSISIKAIEALLTLRYLETKAVLETLLNLSTNRSTSVRDAVNDGLKKLATYDLHIFFGTADRPGIGDYPQRIVIEHIEGLADSGLANHFDSVLTIADALLSPTIRGTTWTHNSFTIAQRSVPSTQSVGETRSRAIEILKRMYALSESTKRRKAVLLAMNDGTRRDFFGERDDALLSLVSKNTKLILDFYESLVHTAEFPVVQKIESLSYWIYYHAALPEVATEALRIETAIHQNTEYQIYKTLIGFEGIFQPWAKLRVSDKDWEGVDELRQERARQYSSEISIHAEVWRNRILRYVETESDDLATFPIFYYFLQLIGENHPEFSLQLVKEQTEKVSPFLIPILRGLWKSSHKYQIEQVIRDWVSENRYLYPCVKMFLDNSSYSLELLQELLRKSIETKQTPEIVQIMTVAASIFEFGGTAILDALFKPSFQYLIQVKESSWIYQIWYRREMRKVFEALSIEDLEQLLKSLETLEEIDYHAEEILFVIAKRNPTIVVRFFCNRILLARDPARKGFKFQAIPFQFYKLQEALSGTPIEAVALVRQAYEGNSENFIYSGGQLLKSIFPDFPASFEAELLKLVRQNYPGDIEFVLAVIRNYEGQLFTHATCQLIIEKLPLDDPLLTDVLIALESTGVVTGELGFVDAYERKISEIRAWLSHPSDKVRQFAGQYIANLENMIINERTRAEERLTLRKHAFGE